MNTMIEGTLSGVVASVIYEIGKNIYFQLKRDEGKQCIDLDDIQKYVGNELGTKYEELFASGIFENYMKSPLIEDTMYNYVLYILTGRAAEASNIKHINLNKNRNIEDDDLIKFFSNNLYEKYKETDTVSIPSLNDIHLFFRDFIKISSEYIFIKLDQDELIISFLFNYRIGMLENRVLDKIDSLYDILAKSTATKIVLSNNDFSRIKEEYTKLIKENNKFAHIYLLDKFLMKDFYVPPFFYSNNESNYAVHSFRFAFHIDEVPSLIEHSMNDLNNWKYIFGQGNIIYITGGAGYGKTLFLKMLICNYEQLNIIDSSNYIVIYGELKNFYLNNSEDPISVVEFLKNCMKKETLMDDKEISNDFINYFLLQGRCIILFDALDEVERNKREKIHSMIVNYFKTQNPNNKICITSRSRGFVPEEKIEVFMIEPLHPAQIKRYVDNIIQLGKFDEKDKEPFLKQAQVLIQKGFLSSFLILSLMINIYKAERELPENKLELYQKCFEYIANRREKEKSGAKYDWALISILMKDNTFMELSNLCLPNNSDVHKDSIKSRLLEIYKNKYVSECQTEQAIDNFLAFCSDRTELFVPATGEDEYKFFHRSFFEYFYSQYLFTRVQSVEEIYALWKNFDVDSEIFELSLAMFKQKNEEKYQEIVGYLFDKINSDSLDEKEKLIALNIFVLCLQVIDDATYKKQFAEFLVCNRDFCVKHIKEIQNQKFISETILTNAQLGEAIAEQYKEDSIYDTICILVKFYEFYQKNDFATDIGRITEMCEIILAKSFLQKFYLFIFYNMSSDNVLNILSKENINLICKKHAHNRKIIRKYHAIPRKFIASLKISFDKEPFLNE